MIAETIERYAKWQGSSRKRLFSELPGVHNSLERKVSREKRLNSNKISVNRQ